MDIGLEVYKTEAEWNTEGVDRSLFQKLVKRCTESGLVLVLNYTNPASVKEEQIQELFRLKVHDTPCANKCSWLIWRDEDKNCWWIQHNLNPEHAKKMSDIEREIIPSIWGTKPNTDIGWFSGEIAWWVKQVHQEEEAYLEEIDDSFRATIRKRHELSGKRSAELEEGLLGFRNYSIT